ncbi:TrmH family RNA methyltransferase [Paenibacillus alvei]|uniref:tRNA/rRNA methyltransferase SpoU n=1 Tax=Paenibacillus alvei TaxID=44250 RepID=A0A383R4G5_PAEAL|nr:RNA methyltransferase [Paenibacillus alvei]SYX81995.1 tRNA/rRNA methyltransferase SpoU [Paenibacillus alvei]
MREPLSITSIQNNKVKGWVQLKERKHRNREGLFIVEGIHLVLEALRSGMQVDVVAYDMESGIPQELKPFHLRQVEARSSDRAQDTEWIAVTDAIIRKCSDTETPQPVFAIVHKLAASVDSLLASSNSLVVVVDGVQDPGNLGTIIRTADAVGADGVVIGKGTVDLYNAKTIRSTMGSLFHLPVVEGDLVEMLPAAQARGVRLASTSLQATHSCYSYDYRPATWLIVGNEGQGVSQNVQSLVDDTIIIPMRGQAESLNVAMATTVLLYEAMRQRHYSQ